MTAKYRSIILSAVKVYNKHCKQAYTGTPQYEVWIIMFCLDCFFEIQTDNDGKMH